MQEVWVAALAINLSLGLCFVCCLRLFSCCIRYAGAFRELLDPDAEVSEQADTEASTYASGSIRLEAMRRLRLLKEQQIAGSRRLWLPRSVYAYVTLLALFVDSAAFAAFSFTTVTQLNSSAHNAAGTFTEIVRRIAKAFLLDFSDRSYSWTFWTAVGIALFTVGMGIYVLVKDSRSNSPPAIIFQIFGMVLLFPICTTLLSVLSCRYNDNESFLAVLPSVKCWEGRHVTMVAVGLITFLFYYTVDAMLLARLIRSIIDADDVAIKEGENAIYTDNGFTVSYFQAKVCISFVVSYWGIDGYSPWICAIFIFIVLLCLVLYSVRTRPSNVDVLNSIRTYSFTFSLMVSICALLSLSSRIFAERSHWFVFAGVLAWLVFVLAHFCTQYGCMECRVFEPLDDQGFNQPLAESETFYESLQAGTGGAVPGTSASRDASRASSPNGRITAYYHIAPPGSDLRPVITSSATAGPPVHLDLPVPNFVTGTGTERYEALYNNNSNKPTPTRARGLSQEQISPRVLEYEGEYNEDVEACDGSLRSTSSFSSIAPDLADAQVAAVGEYMDLSSGTIQSVAPSQAAAQQSGDRHREPGSNAHSQRHRDDSDASASGRRGAGRQVTYINLSGDAGDSIVLL